MSRENPCVGRNCAIPPVSVENEIRADLKGQTIRPLLATSGPLSSRSPLGVLGGLWFSAKHHFVVNRLVLRPIECKPAIGDRHGSAGAPAIVVENVHGRDLPV